MIVASTSVSVKSDDMPALCRAYGAASQTAQRSYLRAQKSLLWMFVGVAVASGLGQVVPLLLTKEHGRHIEIAAACVGTVLFGLGLWLSARQEQQVKPEDWYDARALAESTKSMAWKYMMGAEPYVGDHGDALFTRDLRKLLNDAQKTVRPTGADGPQITDVMRTVRAMPPAQRLTVYRTDRIADQCRWYTKKGEEHAKANRRWRNFVSWTLGSAFALSVLSIVTTPVGAVAGMAASIAPAAIAWNQTRRHRELAHSYAFTSHEIGLLAVPPDSIDDENVARFVADCETAFSREHTMWRARRENREA
jgi:hypothetical protein